MCHKKGAEQATWLREHCINFYHTPLEEVTPEENGELPIVPVDVSPYSNESQDMVVDVGNIPRRWAFTDFVVTLYVV